MGASARSGLFLAIAVGSELDANAGRRVDRLEYLVAVGEAAIDVRDHHAGIEVDALDWPIIEHGGNEVRLAGALAAALGCDSEFISVWFRVGGVDGGAGRGVVVGLLEVVIGGADVELGGDRIFGADKEEGSDPRNIVSRVTGPLRRPKF